MCFVGDVDSMDGLFFGNSPDFFSNFEIKNTRFINCRESFVDENDFYMVDMQNVVCTSCRYGFRFKRTSYKTSLHISSSWAENCGTPWYFNRAIYSSINACGADFCNGWDINNGYGTPYGSKSTEEGVYTFENCDMTVNACGAERSYGNGVFSIVAGRVVLNNPFAWNCKSTFNPNFEWYPNYGFGPVHTSQEYCNLTISNPRFEDWQNEYWAQNHPEKPQAQLVGFNYNRNVYPGHDYCMVFITSHRQTETPTSPIITGIGDKFKHCRAAFDMYTNPRFEGQVLSLIHI